MRFLFFSAQYLPTAGGVERYTFNLCKKLGDMGHSCVVATSYLPGLPYIESDGSIDIIRLPSILFMNGRFPVIKKNRLFKSAVKKIFDGSFDLAVINTRFYRLSLFAARQCYKRGIPSIVIEHGTKHLSMENIYLDFLGNSYEHAAVKYISRYCQFFYGVSDACANWLSHFGVRASGVLYNAVDAAETRLAAESSGFNPRAEFHIETDKKIIVFIGRFIREKGVYELIEAFKKYTEQRSDAALIMVGDGPLFDEIKSEKTPGIFLTGRLNHSDCLGLLSLADIFVLPTYSEGFSSVILEAAALGVCILTTPTGGSPELIQSGKSGILIDDVSPGTICDSLIFALSDDTFRSDAGQIVWREAEESFNWGRTAGALIDIAEKTKRKAFGR